MKAFGRAGGGHSVAIRHSVHSSFHAIDVAAWDACAGAGNPFTRHAFMTALEDSRSIGEDNGWVVRPVTVEDAAGAVDAVLPLFVKLHSYGEYVFDQSWAEGLQRSGGRYYPKLQVASPFTPVPGRRLLRRPDGSVSAAALGDLMQNLCEESDLSSAHVTFCEQAEWEALGKAGWLQRTGMQYHWYNDGYGSFEDFLGAMASRRRKVIKRERREAQNCGLDFVTLRGGAIKAGHWDAFYRFYQSTVDRKWGSAYLTREFFTLLGERLGDAVVLMMAMHEGKPVAGALNLIGGDALYGRNWGCSGDWPFLHFELCYYRAIDFAIEHKLQRVEAGAQGEHKVQRGYAPVMTYSAHHIRHAGLAKAVKQFLAAERPVVTAEMDAMAAMLPFKDAAD